MPTFTRKLSDLLEEGFELGLTELDYPIFDENYREDLNKKILRHYYHYEIGQETESMFRFALNRKMNEIMPYYNQLYLSTQIQFDPLQTMKYSDITDTTDSGELTRNLDSTTNNDMSSETDSKARAVQSETPQVLLSPNEDYASGASNTVSNAVNTGESTNVVDEDVIQTDSRTGNITRNLLGSNGVAADILMRYRQTLLNIDMMVIDDLQTLFMQVWDNGDEYSASEGNVSGYFTGYFGLF